MLNFSYERRDGMVVVDDRERKFLLQRLPSVFVKRTVKSKSNRGKYYAEESIEVLQLLRELSEKK